MAFVTELLGYIGLDVDDASFNEAEQSVKDVTKVMAGLVTIAASVATAVTGAAYAMVNDFANTATEIDQLTKRLNVNAEAFQSTAYAAKSFGIEQDQLADGMKELSMRAGEFALTGEGSFKDVASQLGLTREQVKSYGNDVNGLFNLVRDKLAGIQNQGQRQFLADALFGGGLADVGGEFFSQTSENIEALQKQARESGLVISQENLDMAREYTREMNSLQARIKGLWNIVASNLLPIFTRITRQMKEFFDLHGDEIVNGLTTAIKVLIETIKYLGVAAAIAMPYLVGSAAIASWSKLITLINIASVAFTRMGWAAAIASWSKLITLINIASVAFTRMGWAAAIAWAKALWPVVLIGAAILAVIVIIQDLYTYFTGGDSIEGRIIEAFGKPMIDKIKSAWTDLKAWFKGWIADVGQWFIDLIPDWLKKPAIEGRNSMITSGAGDPNTKQSPFINPGSVPSVVAPPTMAQGLAQANAGRGNVITTNSGNTTVGEIIVNGAENPVATAQTIRQELRRDNASRTKGSDTGVRY